MYRRQTDKHKKETGRYRDRQIKREQDIDTETEKCRKRDRQRKRQEN
jgi:hypothetical protein